MRYIATSILFFTSLLSAQVFNTAHILSKETIKIGVAPVVSNNSVSYYAQVDYGLARNTAVGCVAGLLPSGMYFGITSKFVIAYTPDLSMTVGSHVQGSIVGIDGTLNLSIPITRKFSIYLGGDADLDVISSTTTRKPAWGFLGVRNKFGETIEILFEINPAVTADAQNMYGGCLKLYF